MIGKKNYYISKQKSNINTNQKEAGRWKKINTFLRVLKLRLPMFLHFVWFSPTSPTEYYERMIHKYFHRI